MTRVLPDRASRLADSNFIVRMLFYEAYWQHSLYLCYLCNFYYHFIVAIAFCQLANC